MNEITDTIYELEKGKNVLNNSNIDNNINNDKQSYLVKIMLIIILIMIMLKKNYLMKIIQI